MQRGLLVTGHSGERICLVTCSTPSVLRTVRAVHGERTDLLGPSLPASSMLWPDLETLSGQARRSCPSFRRGQGPHQGLVWQCVLPARGTGFGVRNMAPVQALTLACHCHFWGDPR